MKPRSVPSSENLLSLVSAIIVVKVSRRFVLAELNNQKKLFIYLYLNDWLINTKIIIKLKKVESYFQVVTCVKFFFN